MFAIILSKIIENNLCSYKKIFNIKKKFLLNIINKFIM